MNTMQLDAIDSSLRALLNESSDISHFDLAIKYPQHNDTFIFLADAYLRAEQDVEVDQILSILSAKDDLWCSIDDSKTYVCEELGLDSDDFEVYVEVSRITNK